MTQWKNLKTLSSWRRGARPGLPTGKTEDCQHLVSRSQHSLSQVDGANSSEVAAWNERGSPQRCNGQPEPIVLVISEKQTHFKIHSLYNKFSVLKMILYKIIFQTRSPCKL